MTLQGSPGRMRQCVAPRRRGGALRRAGWAGGGLWPRLRRGRALGAHREERGRGSQRRGERSRGSGENEGMALGVSVASRGFRGGCHDEAGGGGPGTARRHASASRQRLKTAVPLVGWAAKWTGRVGWASTGEAQVSDR